MNLIKLNYFPSNSRIALKKKVLYSKTATLIDHLRLITKPSFNHMRR